MSIVHFSQWSMDNGQWLMVNSSRGAPPFVLRVFGRRRPLVHHNPQTWHIKDSRLACVSGCLFGFFPE
jgi:hypothetical protein